MATAFEDFHQQAAIAGIIVNNQDFGHHVSPLERLPILYCIGRLPLRDYLLSIAWSKCI
jgi:hypothetical protein